MNIPVLVPQFIFEHMRRYCRVSAIDTHFCKWNVGMLGDHDTSCSNPPTCMNSERSQRFYSKNSPKSSKRQSYSKYLLPWCSPAKYGSYNSTTVFYCIMPLSQQQHNVHKTIYTIFNDTITQLPVWSHCHAIPECWQRSRQPCQLSSPSPHQLNH